MNIWPAYQRQMMTQQPVYSTRFRGILLILTIILAQLFFPAVTRANSIAISGYDTVAYFTMKKAMKGNKQYTHLWNGKTWYFASIKHKDMFIANPEKYAPQFNGFCANGLSDGHAVAADPENWRIIDGKLYLFFSEYGRNQWSGDVKPLIQKARETLQDH